VSASGFELCRERASQIALEPQCPACTDAKHLPTSRSPPARSIRRASAAPVSSDQAACQRCGCGALRFRSYVQIRSPRRCRRGSLGLVGWTLGAGQRFNVRWNRTATRQKLRVRVPQDVCCQTTPSWQGRRCALPLHPSGRYRCLIFPLHHEAASEHLLAPTCRERFAYFEPAANAFGAMVRSHA
jgi:hypothetical protein